MYCTYDWHGIIFNYNVFMTETLKGAGGAGLTRGGLVRAKLVCGARMTWDQFDQGPVWLGVSLTWGRFVITIPERGHYHLGPDWLGPDWLISNRPHNYVILNDIAIDTDGMFIKMMNMDSSKYTCNFNQWEYRNANIAFNRPEHRVHVGHKLPFEEYTWYLQYNTLRHFL